MRPNRSGMFDCLAHCATCEWEADTRNAVGLAAQHARRNPTHEVRAEQTIVMIWDPR